MSTILKNRNKSVTLLGIIRSIAIHLSLITESLQGFRIFKHILKNVKFHKEEKKSSDLDVRSRSHIARVLF